MRLSVHPQHLANSIHTTSSLALSAFAELQRNGLLLSCPRTEYIVVLNVLSRLSINYSYSFLLAVAELGGEDRAVWQHVRGRGQPRHHRCAAAPREHHHPLWVDS